MFPKTSLKTSQWFITRFSTIQRPCNSRYSTSSLGGNVEYDNWLSNILLKVICSGVVIIGSTLVFGFSQSSSHNYNTYLFTFAECSSKDNPSNWGSNTDKIPQRKQMFIFGETYRRRVFFNYEKRIRLQSPSEKVFEYFASLRTPEREALMTPSDLMRAIVPVFPPSESNRIREGFLRGERNHGKLTCAPSQFFMLFDTDNDGLISFQEYIFFVTLLRIPESNFYVAFKMFDLNNNGEIDREEFYKVMSLMRAQKRQNVNLKDGRLVKFKDTEPRENGGLLEYFFGKDGNNRLEHERFVQFLRKLHDELEFSHYDYNSQGSISAKDFGLSLVASADISSINKLLDRVDNIYDKANMKDMRITFEEFKNFAMLRKQLESLSTAMFCYGRANGMLTKTDFQRAASQVCGISITDNVVDVIFHVFDMNGDGNLCSDEFIKVLQKREKESLPIQRGFKGLLPCCANCIRNCSS